MKKNLWNEKAIRELIESFRKHRGQEVAKMLENLMDLARRGVEAKMEFPRLEGKATTVNDFFDEFFLDIDVISCLMLSVRSLSKNRLHLSMVCDIGSDVFKLTTKA